MREIKKLYSDWAKDYNFDSNSNIAIVSGEKMILPMLKPTKKDKILDVGCGTGRITKLISKRSKEVIGIDFSEEMLEIAKSTSRKLKNVKYEKVDIIKRLPFKNNSFDKITAILVLNHIKDSKKFLMEIHRVLKKGGVFIFDDFATNFKNPFKSKKENLIVKRTRESEGLVFGKGFQQHINLLHKTGFEIREINFTRIDQTVKPFITDKSFKNNKGRTLEAFFKCIKE